MTFEIGLPLASVIVAPVATTAALAASVTPVNGPSGVPTSPCGLAGGTICRLGFVGSAIGPAAMALFTNVCTVVYSELDVGSTQKSEKYHTAACTAAARPCASATD